MSEKKESLEEKVEKILKELGIEYRTEEFDFLEMMVKTFQGYPGGPEAICLVGKVDESSNLRWAPKFLKVSCRPIGVENESLCAAEEAIIEKMKLKTGEKVVIIIRKIKEENEKKSK